MRSNEEKAKPAKIRIPLRFEVGRRMHAAFYDHYTVRTSTGHETVCVLNPLNLEKAVEPPSRAHLIDSSGYSKKMLITNKVNTHFFDTPSKSSRVTLDGGSTAFSRLNSGEADNRLESFSEFVSKPENPHVLGSNEKQIRVMPEISDATTEGDGLLFVAGQRRYPKPGEHHEERSAFETQLIKRALLTGRPLLTVCGGARKLWEILGGDTITITGHLSTCMPAITENGDMHTGAVHRIQLTPGTVLATCMRPQSSDVNPALFDAMPAVSSVHWEAAKENETVRKRAIVSAIAKPLQAHAGPAVATHYPCYWTRACGQYVPLERTVGCHLYQEENSQDVHVLVIHDVAHPERDDRLPLSEVARKASHTTLLAKLVALDEPGEVGDIDTLFILSHCLHAPFTENSIEAFETRFGAPVMGIQWHPEAYYKKTYESKKERVESLRHMRTLQYMAKAGDAYQAKQEMLVELRQHGLFARCPGGQDVDAQCGTASSMGSRPS